MAPLEKLPVSDGPFATHLSGSLAPTKKTRCGRLARGNWSGRYRHAVKRVAYPHLLHACSTRHTAPVAPAVPGDRRFEEPGAAEIVEAAPEGDFVERGPAVGIAEELLGELHAEPARHADARAAIAHGVVDAV